MKPFAISIVPKVEHNRHMMIIGIWAIRFFFLVEWLAMVPAHGRISSTKEIAAIRAATGDMKHRRHEALMCGSIQLSLASHRVLE